MDETTGRGAAARSEPATYNLLFVCTGNTCRSPMAAAIARRAVAERGWANVEVASAGVDAAVGSPPSANAVIVAGSRGLELRTHRSQPLTGALIEWADTILAMSPSHSRGVAALGGADKSALMGEFLGDPPVPIEDPFGGPVELYALTFEQLEVAIDGLLDRLEPILAP